MSTVEAVREIKPQSKKTGRRKSIRRTLNGYFLVVCLLFVIIAALCINNVRVFRYYTELTGRYSTVEAYVKEMAAERKNLGNNLGELVRENNQLKETYGNIADKNAEYRKQMQDLSSRMEEIKRKNEELERKNKDLTEDNIALQNSLKMAASVGIKPQSYTEFKGLSSRGEIVRGKYLGKFLGTAYTPSSDECGNNKGITNSGEPIIPGISVAIDSRYWPFGTVFYIRGLGYAVAMDTGSAIKGRNRFDFAVFDKNFADTLGCREWDVYLVRMGKGSAGNVSL